MGPYNFLLLILSIFITQGYCNNQTQDEYQVQYVCPPDFIRLGYSCYYFSSEMDTWHNAHFACRDKGSQLLALESQWEDETIRTYLSKPQFARLNRWIGGIYNWTRRQWTWGSTAAVMPYHGFIVTRFPRSYRWHCVFLAPVLNYQWNHDLCTNVMHYICEVPQTRILDPNDIVESSILIQ